MKIFAILLLITAAACSSAETSQGGGDGPISFKVDDLIKVSRADLASMAKYGFSGKRAWKLPSTATANCDGGKCTIVYPPRDVPVSANEKPIGLVAMKSTAEFSREDVNDMLKIMNKAKAEKKPLSFKERSRMLACGTDVCGLGFELLTKGLPATDDQVSGSDVKGLVQSLASRSLH